MGGGDSGLFITELDNFKKIFVQSGRIVPISTFSSIVDMKLSADQLCPYFSAAIIKTQASCPKGKAPNNVCRYITSSDINALSGARRQQMMDAEVILAKARAMVKPYGTEAGINAKLFKVLGRLDTKMRRHVMKKTGRVQ